MGIMSVLKANKALRFQRNGKNAEALRLYEEAIAEGMNDPRFFMPYALLLVREGQYQKAKEFLVAHQKAPLSPGQRVELLVYYATCCFRLGDVDKGINTLEQQYRKGETGLLYQTLGYLYVEKYDQAHKPDFAAAAVSGEAQEAPAEENAEENAEDKAESAEQAEGEEAAAALSPEEEWNAGIEKAEAFIRKSVEYDDEDSISLDNLGEFLYRVRGDAEGAREWFDKAIAIKPGQIDTLYFLSRYDLAEGNKAEALKKLEQIAEAGRYTPLNYCTADMIHGEIAKLKGAQADA